jgi:hypothetical protein
LSIFAISERQLVEKKFRLEKSNQHGSRVAIGVTKKTEKAARLRIESIHGAEHSVPEQTSSG